MRVEAAAGEQFGAMHLCLDRRRAVQRGIQGDYEHVRIHGRRHAHDRGARHVARKRLGGATPFGHELESSIRSPDDRNGLSLAHQSSHRHTGSLDRRHDIDSLRHAVAGVGVYGIVDDHSDLRPRRAVWDGPHGIAPIVADGIAADRVPVRVRRVQHLLRQSDDRLRAILRPVQTA